MSTTPELQPDEIQVLQVEEPDHVVTVPVNVQGPVQTQDLPRKAGATFNKTIGTTPVRLLTADHRRAQARLMSIGQNVYIGFSYANAQEPRSMALWPANAAFTMNVDGELWAASFTGTTVVSVITEMWATGS